MEAAARWLDVRERSSSESTSEAYAPRWAFLQVECVLVEAIQVLRAARCGVNSGLGSHP